MLNCGEIMGLETVNTQTSRKQRDPEDRMIDQSCSQERKEKMMDKTIADSFPASDPPSSLPDPDVDSFESTRSKANPQ
jgi:hypothetical protein